MLTHVTIQNKALFDFHEKNKKALLVKSRIWRFTRTYVLRCGWSSEWTGRKVKRSSFTEFIKGGFVTLNGINIRNTLLHNINIVTKLVVVLYFRVRMCFRMILSCNAYALKLVVLNSSAAAYKQCNVIRLESLSFTSDSTHYSAFSSQYFGLAVIL